MEHISDILADRMDNIPKILENPMEFNETNTIRTCKELPDKTQQDIQVKRIMETIYFYILKIWYTGDKILWKKEATEISNYVRDLREGAQRMDMTHLIDLEEHHLRNTQANPHFLYMIEQVQEKTLQLLWQNYHKEESNKN